MELIIAIYIVIIIVMCVIWLFDGFSDDNFVKYVVLWPLILIKLILKELFKLLFTDWK